MIQSIELQRTRSEMCIKDFHSNINSNYNSNFHRKKNPQNNSAA
eukprot:CAMPEP_0113505498 /NCGR_PEP_ID=MMETSP0014_2-20120614/35354_1 /TAXON_ID=2857 /ORGANISM="Nitzschia sp." /LENGTH=43 /DNA_ID=CAMNT_0000400825 /DNA_START=47 /DNA_END=174 /DNA_ORIENTATION=+ /assembly_acc=CAM_ASM_000159